MLIVPPHHVTAYDPLRKGLKAVPVWEDGQAPAGRRRTVVLEPPDSASAGEDKPLRLGLGIDAGGTCTDAVIYDFDADAVVAALVAAFEVKNRSCKRSFL